MSAEVVKSIVEQHIQEKNYFLVDFNIVNTKGGHQVRVILDSDTGITIDECAELSRWVYDNIDSNNIFPNGFELLLSSPGVGSPLKLERQYIKNIGRSVRILSIDNKVTDGILSQVLPGVGVEIKEVKTKKGKIIEEKIISFPFAEIKKAEVLVSFNQN